MLRMQQDQEQEQDEAQEQEGGRVGGGTVRRAWRRLAALSRRAGEGRPYSSSAG